MSKAVDYTVSFLDIPDSQRVVDECVQGLVRDVFEEYVAVQKRQKNCRDDEPSLYVINTQDDLDTLAEIAARILPVHLDRSESSSNPFPFDYEQTDLIYDVVSDEHDMAYCNLILPEMRTRLFHHEVDSVKFAYYTRYVELFNEGKALFGARTVNINEINFQIY